jgi:protein-disulfide isomerase
VPKTPLAIKSPLVIGSPAATIGVVEFADFECAFCAKFANEVKPRLIKEYVDTGKVFLAFRNYPLKFHKRAIPAALAAGCAARQGKYWDMFDYLFGGPDRLEDAGLAQAGRVVGLRMPEYTACQLDAAMLREVEEDKAVGDELALSGTPTFFFGTRTDGGALSASAVLAGARPFDEFKGILDKLVAGLQ